MKFLAMVRPQVAFPRFVMGAIFCLTIFGLMLPAGSLSAADALSTPTVLGPTQTSQSQPYITGVTMNGTRVAVWIDGTFYGNARVVDGMKGTASFSYKPFLHLAPGIHKVVTRAEDRDSTMVSAKSQDFWLNVEYPRPAPTLVPPPVINDTTNIYQPYIVGVAHNNSFIKVFIDGQLDGQFWVENDPSGVADFAYKPFLRLDPGQDHLVYATATASNGKESSFSNVYGFAVGKAATMTSATGTAAAADTADTEVQASEQDEDQSAAKDESEAKDQDDKADADAKESSAESKKDESIAQSTETEQEKDSSTARDESADEDTNADSDEDEEEDNDEDKDEATEDEDSNEAAGISGDDDEDGNSNLVLWLVVIAIVIIIVVTRLTSRPGEEDGGMDNSQKKVFTEGGENPPSSNSTSDAMPKKDSNTPPPPPPPAASNY